jgi:hypothetical protein
LFAPSPGVPPAVAVLAQIANRVPRTERRGFRGP